MMAGFQAEENLTGRAQKNVRKILDVINVAELPVKSPDGGLVVNLAGIFPDEGTPAGKQQCPLDRLNAK